MVGRQPGSGLGLARWRSGRATRFRTTAAFRTRSRADVGCVHAVRSGADLTRWTNMGRRSAAASSRGCTRTIVGRATARGAAWADVGLALTGTECVRATTRTFMGGAEAGCSATRGAAACTVVGPADSVRCARARRAGRAGTIVVGPGPGRPVVGCSREHVEACHARALMGGARRSYTERTAVRGSIVGRACSPVMGSLEEPRTRGAGSAIVVCPVGGTAASSTVNTCRTAARSCCGPIVVAAGRVTGPA